MSATVPLTCIGGAPGGALGGALRITRTLAPMKSAAMSDAELICQLKVRGRLRLAISNNSGRGEGSSIQRNQHGGSSLLREGNSAGGHVRVILSIGGHPAFQTHVLQGFEARL